MGQTLGAKLAELDHEVKLGSRDPAKRSEWSREAGGEASTGTFEETAAHGELVFVATLWEGTRNALQLAGDDSLTGGRQVGQRSGRWHRARPGHATCRQ